MYNSKNKKKNNSKRLKIKSNIKLTKKMYKNNKNNIGSIIGGNIDGNIDGNISGNNNIDTITGGSIDLSLFKKLKEKEWVYKYYNKDDDDTVNKSSKNKPKRCMCINYQSLNDFKTYDRCPRNVINKTDFCELHQQCKSYLRNFLSGDELEYKPELWSDPYIEGSHNCYSYFLNRQVKAVKEKCNEICEKKHKSSCPKKDSECTDLKPQPGDFELIKRTGTDKDKERIYKCPNMHTKIMKDNPTLQPVPFNAKCPKNFYKGAYVVDPDNTYHFYRTNKDGSWSHKPGISPISNVDSSKQNIYVPHFANRNYEEDEDNDEAINYTNFCGYYCIPTNNTIHKNLA
jgi:hypothetical protein